MISHGGAFASVGKWKLENLESPISKELADINKLSDLKIKLQKYFDLISRQFEVLKREYIGGARFHDQSPIYQDAALSIKLIQDQYPVDKTKFEKLYSSISKHLMSFNMCTLSIESNKIREEVKHINKQWKLSLKQMKNYPQYNKKVIPAKSDPLK